MDRAMIPAAILVPWSASCSEGSNCWELDPNNIAVLFGSVFVDGSIWFKRRGFRYLPESPRVMSCLFMDLSRQ